MIQVTPSTIALLKKAEGYSDKPYSDGYGYSIGYGHYLGQLPLLEYKGRVYNYKIPLPIDTAEDLLKDDLSKRAAALNSVVTVPLSQNQADAVLKWSFSLGPEAIKTSTLPQLINKGNAKELITWWVNHYTTVKGIENASLVARREDEADLFLSDEFPAGSGFFLRGWFRALLWAVGIAALFYGLKKLLGF